MLKQFKFVITYTLSCNTIPSFNKHFHNYHQKNRPLFLLNVILLFNRTLKIIKIIKKIKIIYFYLY
jgi:hypothetical protein